MLLPKYQMLSARVLRRRWILLIFVFICLLFLIYTNLDKVQKEPSDLYQVEHSLLRQTFQWQPKVPDVEANVSSIVRCRNSVQGRQYLVDERGYVCGRDDLLTGGCCSIKTTKTTRYNCSTCKINGCCYLFEHCVSCCLQPEKQPILQRVLQQAEDNVDKLIVSVNDHFELCLTKCRTSSKSVQHENSYRDPKAKHCYGEDPPDLQMAAA